MKSIARDRERGMFRGRGTVAVRRGMRKMDEPSLTLVIPALNEEQAIGAVVAGIIKRNYSFLKEIIVVDDGSQDDTSVIAGAAGARVIRHRQNLGYGASLKTGLRAALGTYALTMDADGQHCAEDIEKLWMQRGDCDMVVGQRTKLIHSALWRMPGKWFLGMMANFLAKRRIPDLNSGFRLFKTEVVRKYCHLCPQGFSFSTTITMAMFARGYAVRYVPITVNPRIGKSTVSIATGFDTIILILRIATLFNPLRIFLPMSFSLGVVGTVWTVPYLMKGQGVSSGSLIAFMAAVILFAIGLLSDQISQLRLERFE